MKEAITKLIQLRTQAKRRKPYFVVKESHHGGRVRVRWRFPQGIHSQVRQMHKGKPAMPTTGYRSPRAVRGLHSSGLRPVVVHTSTQLLSLNPAQEGAVLGATVGQRKRLELLQQAAENKIRILNVKNSLQAAASIAQGLKERQKTRQEKIKVKSTKEEEKKQKAAEKKKKGTAATPDKKGKTDLKSAPASVEEKVQQEEAHSGPAPEEQEAQRVRAEKTIIKKQ